MVKEDREKKAICRDYMRNMCSRGEGCKYEHPDKRLIFCHDYQNGKCKRGDCMFVHCSRDDEEHYNQFGELPPHLGEPQGDLPPVCKDFMKGDCNRIVCKFRHVLLRPCTHEPPDKRPRLEMVTVERWSLEEENAMLRRSLGELKKRVSDLEATNEFLLEQNARIRLSDLPTVIPQAITATVPVSIAAVAGTPVSIAATVQIPPVTTVSQRHEQNTSQSLQASLVSYPIVARLPTIDSALH